MRTDRYDEAIVAFHKFANAPKNNITVWVSSSIGSVGSKPIRSMDTVHNRASRYVLYSWGTGLAIRWSLTQGVIPKFQRVGSTVPEVNIIMGSGHKLNP